jgi:dUTP pyrophosphatase
MTLVATSRENVPVDQPPAKVQRTEPVEQLRVKRLSENATLPKRGSAGAAGYDLARCANRPRDVMQLSLAAGH